MAHDLPEAAVALAAPAALRRAAAALMPPDHPQRAELNEEVHARPAEALAAPLRLSYLALLTDPAQSEGCREAVAALAERRGIAPPARALNHFSADLGPYRIRWERHTEFSRLTVMVPGAGDDPFAEPALAALPPEWVAALPGETIMAAHVALVRAADPPLDHEQIAARFFGGNVLVGAAIAGGAAVALTDVRVRPDGFVRFHVQDRGMTPWQAGRQIQRLLEIDTYRVMALLALPVARALSPFLTGRERELAAITAALLDAGQAADEATLLDRLTRLAAEIESREAENLYRFSAADAYYELVQRRIAELREIRIEGLQTLQEFTERRVAPAMGTCRAVAARQEALSARVARATGLLSTRVEIAREGQTQAVLEQMNRRAKMQLRLQQTVEGLSVAAITYYIVGLMGYLAKGVAAAGVPVNEELAVGLSIPAVALLVAMGVRSIRRSVTRTFGG